MKTFKSIYLWQIIDKLKDGEVYVLDRKVNRILEISQTYGARIVEIVNHDNTDNCFDAWVVEETESADE